MSTSPLVQEADPQIERLLLEEEVIDGLSDEETAAALSAIIAVRQERLAHLAHIATLKRKATWRNILTPHNNVGLHSLLDHAADLGYDLIEWNGWIYQADLAQVGVEKYQICLAEDVKG